jgi:hypothetical protein
LGQRRVAEYWIRRQLLKEGRMSSTGREAATAQQAQVPGITRIDLQRHDLSAPGREVIQNRVEISDEAR